MLFTSRRPRSIAGGMRHCPTSCSRLQAGALRRRSAQPDDALLKAVLVKLFLDRQLAVDANVVALRRATSIERSLARRGSRSWRMLDLRGA